MKDTKGMRVATVWKLCLEMWDWIADRIRSGDGRVAAILKMVWLEEHGYDDLKAGCFFCDYRLHKGGSCSRCCPGAIVSPRFQCDNTAYHYLFEPLKFVAKLHKMNKKRLEMNRAKR